LQFAISVIGVVVFVGLTAWDTQQIKEMYVDDASAGGEARARPRSWARSGSLDFINLFMMLLQLLGNPARLNRSLRSNPQTAGPRARPFLFETRAPRLLCSATRRPQKPLP